MRLNQKGAIEVVAFVAAIIIFSALAYTIASNYYSEEARLARLIGVSRNELASASDNFGIPEEDVLTLDPEEIEANNDAQNLQDIEDAVSLDTNYLKKPTEVFTGNGDCPYAFEAVDNCWLNNKNPENVDFHASNSNLQLKTYATMNSQPQELWVSWPKKFDENGEPSSDQSESRAKRPLIIMVHGGGWTSGTKDNFINEIRMLASKGYVAASVDYRLAWVDDSGSSPVYHNSFPAAIEDVKCSIRWLKARSNVYGINTSKVIIMGTSAGGHLSMLAGFSDENAFYNPECGHSRVSPKVHGVISYYGPTDLRANPDNGNDGLLPDDNKRVIFLGGQPINNVDVAESASPFLHVDNADNYKDPPLLLVHSTEDETVRIEQSYKMANKISEKDGKYVFIELGEIGGVNHGTYWIRPFSLDEAVRKATCTGWDFIQEIVNPSSV